MYTAADLDRKSGRPPKNDHRSAFARDRDRVIYSPAFRRLAGKTQVVAVSEFGPYHTRMTHSVKVAQVGRSIAERIQWETAERAGVAVQDSAPDPTLVEAACLAHDLGHPPFGHVGEQALCDAIDALVDEETRAASPKRESEANLANAIHERQRRAGGFEGNAQTFRIVTYLSIRGLAQGLDLTRATLDAVTKYPWARGQEPLHPRKWGFYPAEIDLMNWMREAQVGQGQRKSFEAQIMDWADDVTYACHDVEDFYRVGLIPLDRLFDYRHRDPKELPPEAGRFFDWVEAKWNAATSPGAFDRERAMRVWRQLSNLFLLFEPFRATRQLETDIRRTTSELLSFFADELRVTGTSPRRLEGSLEIPPDQRLACNLLNELIWFYVIDQPALATQQGGQSTIVKELFMAYAQGGERLLPENRREELDEHGDKLRCISDHIASMTESQAVALHRRLYGADAVGILAPIWAT